MGSTLTISRPAVSAPDGMLSQPGVGVTSHELNVVCAGAHPDDPETGCGGTLARLANEGHRVSIIYLTRGEAGVENGDRKVTARVRTAEAERGATLLGAQAYFGDQIDGRTSTEGPASQAFASLLASLDPDVVFAHWPLYPYHLKMEEERGSEAQVKRAEAFVGVRYTRLTLPPCVR